MTPSVGGGVANRAVVNASALAAGDWTWDDAPESWQTSLRELAVVLVADWPGLGLST